MTLLDLDALQPELVRSSPFRWASIPRLIPRDSAARLRESFPTEDFWPNEGDDGEKTYAFGLRPLLTQDSKQVAPLTPLPDVWHGLAAELVAPEFRAAMGHMLGLDTADCGIEADLFRFGPGNWMGPHRDMPAKVASLIVYLNDDGWQPASGGCLRILGSRDEADVAVELPPSPGSGALVVRSRSSWHSVTRVTGRAPSDRISMQVILWHPERESSNWTVDPHTGEISAGTRVYNGSRMRRARDRLLGRRTRSE